MPPHYTEIYSKYNKTWNVEVNEGLIGGRFKVNNLSGGYHKIMKQWWEEYNKGTDVLLISENNTVKTQFSNEYPEWNIKTMDLYPEISSVKNQVDIIGDIASKKNPLENKYDLIINQATMEHLYNPFQAMENMCLSLKSNGYLISHTHPPGMFYHQHPRDYFRFMKDWFYDLPKYIKDIELIEFYMINNYHVFTCYRKL